jgi:hypothetical protein
MIVTMKPVACAHPTVSRNYEGTPVCPDCYSLLPAPDAPAERERERERVESYRKAFPLIVVHPAKG